MPRKRTGERTKGAFDHETVAKAVNEVRAGKSLRAAAKEYGLKKSTLQRYVKGSDEQEDLSAAQLTPNYACRRVFSEAMEKNLAEYLIECAIMGFGLDTDQVRSMAFQMAQKNALKFPPGWQKDKKAGYEWLYGYRKRHPELSMRKPEACSVSRASAFTRENMKIFFDNLKKAMDRHPCFSDGSRVYNLDEIGTTTVGSVKRKIMAPTGVKQIPQSKTAERGTLVTTTCIIGANGTALPPIMVFPRVHFQDHVLLNAYPGTLGLAAPSGWMNGELFPEVLRHFVKHTKSSKENPTLLVMDNDSSHLALPALDIAKENGVTLLTLSPHTSHKTQPLDVAVFSPFRAYYDNAMRSWIMSNPGKSVTIYHVATFVKEAMEKAMTPGTILSGFRKCGIFPFNPAIFTEADYISSSPFREAENRTETESGAPPVETADTASVPTPPGQNKDTVADAAVPPADQTPGASRSNFIGAHEIRGLPKQSGPRAAKPNRRKGRSMIPTDTPEKSQLEAAAAARKRPAKGKKSGSNAKRACIPAKKGKKKSQSPSPPTSDDDADDPAAVPLADSDASETWVEEEEDKGPQAVDPAALEKLQRNPVEEDYVLLKIRTPTGNKKKQEVTFKIGKVISSPDEHGCVVVSLLKKSQKVKDKFLICDPVQVETVNIKKSIVMILPKPTVAGTKRQQYNLSFNVNLSLVPFKE